MTGSAYHAMTLTPRATAIRVGGLEEGSGAISFRSGAGGSLQKHLYIRKSSFLESQKQLQKQSQKEPTNTCFFNFFKASKKL